MGVLSKVELHCHMDGILDPGMLRDLRRSDPTFPILPEEFEKAYSITDIQSFFGWWNFIRPFECSMESEYEALTRVFGFEESDWRRIYNNSLAARFQPDLRVGNVLRGA